MGKRKLAGIEAQLRNFIVRSGLTHYRLALNSGVSAPIIDRFVGCERGVTLETAAKLCKALGLELTTKS